MSSGHKIERRTAIIVFGALWRASDNIVESDASPRGLFRNPGAAMELRLRRAEKIDSEIPMADNDDLDLSALSDDELSTMASRRRSRRACAFCSSAAQPPTTS
jgi:hypothetical protein